MLKFGTKTNLNMQNSVVAVIISVLYQKYSFSGKFDPKNQNCLFTLKFEN